MDSDGINLERPVPFNGHTRPQPFKKPSELVLMVISRLKETKGSTRKQIMDYINEEYSCSGDQLKRSVNTALRRGVQYGLLRVENGHFIVDLTDDDNLTMVARARGCGRNRGCPRNCKSRSRRRRSLCRCRSRCRRRSRRRGDRSRCKCRHSSKRRRCRRGCEVVYDDNE